jgi:hypothetical protein
LGLLGSKNYNREKNISHISKNGLSLTCKKTFEAMCRDGHLHYRDGLEAWDALYQTISDRGHAWLASRHWTPCFKQK